MKTLNDFLIEARDSLTHAGATAIWKALGVDPSGMSDEEMKKAHRQLIVKYHPDKGGGAEKAQDINRAYDILKQFGGGTRTATYPKTKPRTDPNRWADKYNKGPFRDDYPEWATAGYSGGIPDSTNIYQNNYNDKNYIKKRLWEISDPKTRQEWTFWQFDGLYTRGVFTAFCDDRHLPEGAEAMVQWGKHFKTFAVIAQRRLRGQKQMAAYVIYAKDKVIPPLTVYLDQGWHNDRQTLAYLRDQIEREVR